MNYTQNSPQIKQKKQENHDLISDLLKKCEALSESEKKVCDSIFNGGNNYRWVYYKQRRIAAHCGIARETVNRICKKLHALGFLTIRNRPGTTNVYMIADWFHDPEYRWALSKFFPSLLFIIAILMSPKKAAASGSHHTLVNPRSSLFNNPSLFKKSKSSPCPCCGEYGDGIGQKKKERVSMQYFKREKMLLNVSEAVGLNLTQYGALQLNMFPDQALHAANQQLENANKHQLRDPFGFVVRKAQQWCEENGWIPDRMGIKQKWETLGWPHIDDVPKVKNGNVYIKTPKPINGKSEAAPKYREFTGHTLPQGYKFKTWEQETSDQMEKTIDDFLQTDEWATRAKAMGPQMTASMVELIRASIANKKEVEKQERTYQEERTVSEASQMKIE